MDLASGVSPPLWTTREARLRLGGATGKGKLGWVGGRCQLPCFAGSHYCSLVVLGGKYRLQNDTEYSSIGM